MKEAGERAGTGSTDGSGRRRRWAVDPTVAPGAAAMFTWFSARLNCTGAMSSRRTSARLRRALRYWRAASGGALCVGFPRPLVLPNLARAACTLRSRAHRDLAARRRSMARRGTADRDGRLGPGRESHDLAGVSGRPEGQVAVEIAAHGREHLGTGKHGLERLSGSCGESGRGGAPGGTRTHDLQVRNLALYPLSYGRAMVAEREGFEPSRQVTPPGGLANRCTRPLCDLSGPRPADSSRRPVAAASRGRTGRSGPRDRVGDRERGKHPFLCAGSPGGSDRRPRRAGPGPATGTGDRDWASDPVIGWHDRNRSRGAWKRGGSRGWPRFRAHHGSG